MTQYLLLLLGGGLGSMLRYGVQNFAVERWGPDFPWGTIAVNIVGSFIIGVAATLADEVSVIAPMFRLFLVVGILGGFTTFSSFSLETWRLAEGDELVRATLNVALSVGTGLVAVFAGVFVARIAGQLFNSAS